MWFDAANQLIGPIPSLPNISWSTIGPSGMVLWYVCVFVLFFCYSPSLFIHAGVVFGSLFCVFYDVLFGSIA